MPEGDLLTGGAWPIICAESSEPHELRMPMHPFSPAAGVVREKGHVFIWTEARARVAVSRDARGGHNGGANG
jgi:hypothetical protein